MRKRERERVVEREREREIKREREREKASRRRADVGSVSGGDACVLLRQLPMLVLASLVCFLWQHLALAS